MIQLPKPYTTEEAEAALAHSRARTHPTHNIITIRLHHDEQTPPSIMVNKEPHGTCITFSSPHPLELETVHIRQHCEDDT